MDIKQKTFQSFKATVLSTRSRLLSAWLTKHLRCYALQQMQSSKIRCGAMWHVQRPKVVGKHFWVVSCSCSSSPWRTGSVCLRGFVWLHRDAWNITGQRVGGLHVHLTQFAGKDGWNHGRHRMQKQRVLDYDQRLLLTNDAAIWWL